MGAPLTVLSALLTLSTVLTAGCGFGAGEGAEGPCDGHPLAQAREYCHVALAEQQPQLGVGHCEQAGRWESECRSVWVSVGLKEGLSRGDALSACDDAVDCAFMVLDARPKGGLLQQLEACHSHTGRHAIPCQEHATWRWLSTGPDAAELSALAQDGRFPERVAEGLARAAGCQAGPGCEGWSAAHRLPCEQILADIKARPELCQPPPSP